MQYNPGIKSFLATEALAPHRRVKLSSTAGWVEYADDDAGIGATLASAKIGENVAVQPPNYNGTMLLEAAGVIALGAEVVCAADGKIAATGSHRVVGMALQAAAAAGDVIEVLPMGGTIKKTVTALYDFAVHGGAQGAIKLGVVIPNKAVITQGFIDVLTTCTSANDSATIAVHANAANDLVTATAISAAGDIWDAGRRSVIPAGTGATAVKCTAAREITVTVAVQDLTAGKFLVCLDYVISL